MNKKALLTGVAGFVGSHMAAYLLKKGFQVIGIDNMSQGFERNLTELKSNKNFSFHNIDVCNFDAMMKVSENLTHIVHLAAFKIPRYGGALDTLRINTKGTENVLEIARQKENIKVLFSSTSDIYGKNPNLPFNEESSSVVGSPKVQRWSYAVSKMFDEQMCFAYAEAYAIPVTVIRYFGGFGPHQNPSWWGGPQAAFMAAILDGKTIEIHGDGLQTRSFTYIDDMIEGTYQALVHENSDNDVFNIGDDREINILDFAQKVWEATGQDGKVPVEMIPYETFGRYEDVRRRVPDISKTQKILGFRAKTNLEEALKRTFEWQKNL